MLHIIDKHYELEHMETSNKPVRKRQESHFKNEQVKNKNWAGEINEQAKDETVANNQQQAEWLNHKETCMKGKFNLLWCSISHLSDLQNLKV